MVTETGEGPVGGDDLRMRATGGGGGGCDPPTDMRQSQAGPAQCQFSFTGDFLPESFRVTSTQLAMDVVHYICQHGRTEVAPSRVCIIMRGLVDDTLQQRLSMMNSLVATLDVKGHKEIDLLHSIATSLFDDQVVNWGRIVTLHAFCGYLARHCQERGLHGCSDAIAEALVNIVVNRLGLWIVANGGWSAFEKQFPPVCVWDSAGLWKGVAIIVLLIGVIVAFYCSMRYVSGS